MTRKHNTYSDVELGDSNSDILKFLDILKPYFQIVEFFLLLKKCPVMIQTYDLEMPSPFY